MKLPWWTFGLRCEEIQRLGGVSMKLQEELLNVAASQSNVLARRSGSRIGD